MADSSETVRLPLEPLRRRVADATGESASFVELTGVDLTANTLEVTYTIPDEDVPVVEVIVEGPNGETDTTPVRLDAPAGLRVYGELLRIEYAGRDAETDEILVSVSHRRGDDWHTLLGCGQMWAVPTERNGESISLTCHVETPSVPEEEDESDAEVDDEPEADQPDGPDADFSDEARESDEGGFLSGLD
ncbi:hypothetical protein [Halobellus sp. EA9]|uniref:hypothetical protein n=1 Tax=Halobellus sp. EA9 TaxID=3421647 RepID=UPI003EBB4D9D